MSDPRTQDAVALTAELVGIDSVNPALVAGAAGEHAIASYVRDWAAACGLASRTILGPDSRPSVIVRGGRGSTNRGRRRPAVRARQLRHEGRVGRLAAAGIPTVLFGPSGDGAHAETEWVDLDSVLSCARALTTLACDLAA